MRGSSPSSFKEGARKRSNLNGALSLDLGFDGRPLLNQGSVGFANKTDPSFWANNLCLSLVLCSFVPEIRQNPEFRSWPNLPGFSGLFSKPTRRGLQRGWVLGLAFLLSLALGNSAHVVPPIYLPPGGTAGGRSFAAFKAGCPTSGSSTQS